MLIASAHAQTIPIYLLTEGRFDGWLRQQAPATQNWLAVHGFKAERNKLALVPDAQGQLAAVLFGLGKSAAGEGLMLWQGAALPERLPEGDYRIDMELKDTELEQLALGWEYAQYRFERYRKPVERKRRALLVPERVIETVTRLNTALSLARDLINTPANDLGPQQLAQTVVEVAQQQGATVRRYIGDELLTAGFPLVHAVGRAATVAPQLVDFEWGNAADPRVTLVGKGVCFDSGGLDIKPPSSMLLMKKDMGGAACTVALAQLIMQARLKVRLRVIIPAVENAIAGNAFRPGDVVPSRAGLSVEVGNTDAEGRLVLADGLALADVDAPELLIDMATLTGAARVALGPELPALFTQDAELARQLMRCGESVADPVWHLPLWPGYDDELSSKVADLNNVSSTGFSGAIIGGLFLQRFVTKAKQWVHLDLFAWNSKDRPGRAVGGEAQCVRMLFAYLSERFGRAE